MQRYKFRGLVADEPCEWVYGALIREDCIHQTEEHSETKCCGRGTFTVYKDSVALALEVYDKDGVEIYSKDTVEFDGSYWDIAYKQGAFVLWPVDKTRCEYALLIDVPKDRIKVVARNLI